MIKATVTTFGKEFAVEFDATDWFRQAEHSDIIAFARDGWGYGQTAEDFVLECSNRHSQLEPLLRHCDDTDIGYSLTVDIEAAKAYLKEHRPEVIFVDGRPADLKTAQVIHSLYSACKYVQEWLPASAPVGIQARLQSAIQYADSKR